MVIPDVVDLSEFEPLPQYMLLRVSLICLVFMCYHLSYLITHKVKSSNTIQIEESIYFRYLADYHQDNNK